MTSCAGSERLIGAAEAWGQEVAFAVPDDEPIGLNGLRVGFDDERAVSGAGVMLANRLGVAALDPARTAWPRSGDPVAPAARSDR